MKKIINILTALVLSTFAFTFFSCAENGKQLKLYSWTYYTPTEVKEAFEKEFDCKIILTEYDSNETMYNKLVNGGAKSFDIVVPSQDYVTIMIQRGMLQPIDQSKFTNREKINPEIIKKMTFDPDMTYAVPYYYGAAGISVNKKKVPEGSYERNWNIFGNPLFKDHASMMDDYREV